MNISWKDKKTNEYVREKVKEALGQRDIPGLVEIIKKRKLKYFGHQMRKEHSLAATIIQAKLMDAEGKAGHDETGEMIWEIGRNTKWQTWKGWLDVERHGDVLCRNGCTHGQWG